MYSALKLPGLNASVFERESSPRFLFTTKSEMLRLAAERRSMIFHSVKMQLKVIDDNKDRAAGPLLH
jgi:hypothetical protein